MKLTVICLALLLSACAGTNDQPVNTIAADDLAAAIAQAKTSNNAVALQCWMALQTALPGLRAPSPEIRGAASAIQAKRAVRGRIEAGVPPAIEAGCAQLYVQERASVLKDLAAFVGLR